MGDTGTINATFKLNGASGSAKFAINEVKFNKTAVCLLNGANGSFGFPEHHSHSGISKCIDHRVDGQAHAAHGAFRGCERGVIF